MVNENHLHDLGKLLFAFSTFWAYIWVSQYLLIWYGNLPEEITYYVAPHRRGRGSRSFLLNLVVNWVVPFLVLLPRASKRNARVLKWIAIVVLAGRWLDLYCRSCRGMWRGPGLDGSMCSLPRVCTAGILPARDARARAARRSCR